MKSTDEWELRPLHTFIYSIMAKKREMDYRELVKEVTKKLKNVDEGEIRAALMKLEIWGKIQVVSVTERQRKIVLKE